MLQGMSAKISGVRRSVRRSNSRRRAPERRRHDRRGCRSALTVSMSRADGKGRAVAVDQDHAFVTACEKFARRAIQHPPEIAIRLHEVVRTRAGEKPRARPRRCPGCRPRSQSQPTVMAASSIVRARSIRKARASAAARSGPSRGMRRVLLSPAFGALQMIPIAAVTILRLPAVRLGNDYGPAASARQQTHELSFGPCSSGIATRSSAAERDCCGGDARVCIRLRRRSRAPAGAARPFRAWPCYHTELDVFSLGGREGGIAGRQAVVRGLMGEELFESGWKLLVCHTSAPTEPADRPRPRPWFSPMATSTE